MRNKIVYENYDEQTGISIVTIQNKYGKFTGKAKCHPNDEYSSLIGYRYAEIRANANYAKYRYRQEKIKLKAIDNLFKDILINCDSKKCGVLDVVGRVTLEQHKCIESVRNWKNYYEYLSKLVTKQDKMRADILLRTNKVK